ncbi:MAG: type IV toxin-antitoxin system AbiEi family antitoxin [Rhodoglobus sp.]|nr:type IV toxin-antitoxin system AbiEi family antitoxin [Rhodoglobus sp.]
MTHRQPTVLSREDLPLAELLAARLDGEVFAIGRGFAPVDEFDLPSLRAASLSSGLNGRLIAEQHTAAWIWGARVAPPSPHEFCAALDARVAHSLSSWLTVREVMIDAADVVVVGGVQVTTPLRTAIDLARFSSHFDADRRVVAALMHLGDFGLPECVAQLDRRRNLPNKRMAAERLSGVHAIDVIHGIDAPHGVQNAIEMSRVAHLEDVSTHG